MVAGRHVDIKKDPGSEREKEHGYLVVSSRPIPKPAIKRAMRMVNGWLTILSPVRMRGAFGSSL
jgi:hypothetical protein